MMTKKDGDKLRKIQADLYDMADLYERGSITQYDMWKVAAAIQMTLEAKKFSIANANIAEAYRKHQNERRTGGTNL